MIERFKTEINVLKEEIKMLWILVISSGAAAFKMLFKFSEIYFSGKGWILGAKLNFLGGILCITLTLMVLIGIVRRSRKIYELLDRIENIRED